MGDYLIGSRINSLDELYRVIEQGQMLSLSEQCVSKVNQCRSYLDRKIENSDQPVYGVNTGFGSLCNTSISKDEIAKLQENLVVSHACGVGAELTEDVSKIILLLKIINLSWGHSGIKLETLQRLVDMYNFDVIPVLYEQGSLGASGDLAPLAHMSLPLLGKGKVWYQGQIVESSEVLKDLKWQPLVLASKEGLALLNGTQFMSAHAFYILREVQSLVEQSFLVTAASIDAFKASLDPFYAGIHEVRSHSGQTNVAQRIRELLKGSEISNEPKEDVQDPYSFRCVPQVHGASLDSLQYAEKVVLKEINSVTDNPIIFPEEDKIISAGNFHGQPLALILDFMSIAISELASISERRVYKLISGLRGLPAYLISEPGLNSGFMIPQYTAASLVSQNKQLSTPSSVDTIDSSNGQEDHVSMGANGALKCHRVLNNYKKVLAIELLNASQALWFREPLKSSKAVVAFIEEFRKEVPILSKDEELHIFIRKAEKFLERVLIFDFSLYVEVQFDHCIHKYLPFNTFRII